MATSYPYCFFRENGCPWLTAKCGLFTTAKAEMKLRYHSIDCIYSPLVAQERQCKREKEAAETGCSMDAEDDAKARCDESQGSPKG